MMNNLNFYYAWSDPMFYAWAAFFLCALAGAVYSLRRLLELNNSDGEEDFAVEEPAVPGAAPEPQELFPAEPAPAQEAPAAEEPADAPPLSAEPSAAAEETVRIDPAEFIQPAPEPQPAPAPEGGVNRAEQFLKGLYEAVGNLDRRMASLEEQISKDRINSDFTVKFLEDLVADIDSIDKEKIKARLEYLVGDLKK